MGSRAISANDGVDELRWDLPGPFPVGRYATRLGAELDKMPRVQLIGEVTGFKVVRAQAYFELRDGEGAISCGVWLADIAKTGFEIEGLQDGIEVVIAGGPEYYAGGAQASPRFAFRATQVRVAGEGDLLLRLAALREQLKAEGLFELQKQLPRPLLPKTIGVVTAEGGAARDDLLVSLARRGWAGTLVWAFAPVQDRHAAPLIAAAIQDLAARPEIDTIVITRGGGSLADLWAFCDETLCRTVAMLRVPVISAVGHERDVTLIDDVSAVACSTPTHAAEAAVPMDCFAARRDLDRDLASLQRASEMAAEVVPRRQLTRSLASLQRAVGGIEGRGALLRQMETTLRAFDSDAVLKRGFALVEGETGEPVISTEAAAAAEKVKLRFSDGSIGARIEP